MNKKKPTSINIDSLLWQESKIEAVRRGITVTELLESALRNELSIVKNNKSSGLEKENSPNISQLDLNKPTISNKILKIPYLYNIKNLPNELINHYNFSPSQIDIKNIIPIQKFNQTDKTMDSQIFDYKSSIRELEFFQNQIISASSGSTSILKTNSKTDYYPTNWYDEFLIMATRLSHGDLNKRLKVNEVWEKLGLKTIEGKFKEQLKRNTTNILASKSLIKKINDEEICITYETIDLAVKLTNEPYTNFGLVSWNELEERTQNYIHLIYNGTELKKRPITISELSDLFQGYPNINVIKQISRFYSSKGLLSYDEIRNLISKTDKGQELSRRRTEH